MADFTLDTSGAVYGQSPYWGGTCVFWSDLTPFQQGYVEGLFAAFEAEHPPRFQRHRLAFTDLHPETLAAILKDCAVVTDRIFAGTRMTADDGRRVWGHRAEGFPGPLATDLMLRDALPPLTVFLDDEGKVRTREAGR